MNPQKKNPQRIKLEDREIAKRLDYSDITFPVTVDKIPKIEKQNNININLFSYEEKKVFPIYISKAEHPDHMELLYIDGQYNGEERQHYVYIKDFSRLMYNFTKHRAKAFLYELSSMLLFKRVISKTQRILYCN